MLLEKHIMSDTLERSLLELLKSRNTLSADYERELLNTIELSLRANCSSLLKQHEEELKHILYTCLLDWGISNGDAILRSPHASNELCDTVSALWSVAIKHFKLNCVEYKNLY